MSSELLLTKSPAAAAGVVAGPAIVGVRGVELPPAVVLERSPRHSGIVGGGVRVPGAVEGGAVTATAAAVGWKSVDTVAARDVAVVS